MAHSPRDQPQWKEEGKGRWGRGRVEQNGWPESGIGSGVCGMVGKWQSLKDHSPREWRWGTRGVGRGGFKAGTWCRLEVGGHWYGGCVWEGRELR